MMWKPDVVIYHDHCADGFAAAWACFKRFGITCDYVPANYGQPAPKVQGKHVLMVDFSYKRAALDELAKSAASVVILDHHKTAEAELEVFRFREREAGSTTPEDIGGMLRDLAELNRPPVVAIFDMHRSGAHMAWDFCHGVDETPMLIQLVEDRDLWLFKLPETKAFSLWLRSEPFSFGRFNLLAQELHDVEDSQRIMTEAAAMQRFFDAKVEEIASFARRRRVGEHEAIVVNCPPMFASEVGHALLDKHPDAPFAAMYFDGPSSRMWSLRSRDDREDVSAVAAKFGGGGHRNAAGFGAPL
jgi:oligoribonuclease NrnB/cAMP/cGMP phosphodiesterase (DHH superfamily)